MVSVTAVDVHDWTCKSIIYMNEHHLHHRKMHISNMASGHAKGVGVQICIKSKHKSQMRSTPAQVSQQGDELSVCVCMWAHVSTMAEDVCVCFGSGQGSNKG